MKLSGMELSSMNIFGITIIEHADLAADEGWVIFDRNAPQIPENLRETLPIPCILTGDIEQTKHMLAFLRAVAVPYTSDLVRQPTAAMTLLGDLHRHASLQIRIS